MILNKVKKVKFRDYGVTIGFLIICIIISIASPTFLSKRNILNLLRQSSIIGIISAGMTFVIISGNFDISVGAVAALEGAITMKLATLEVPLIFAILAAIAVSAVIGLINGFFVSKVRVPSLIATMAMVTIVRGLLLMITGGYPITQEFKLLNFLGSEYILGIPVPVILFFIVVLISHIVLTKTKFGRHVFSVGGNQEASKLNGINVDAYKIKVFIINAILAAIAGIVLTGRLGTATAIAGEGYDMDAIASVVIGGTSVTGGSGSAIRTVVGVLLMGVINNSFNLLSVNIYFQYILKGLIILIAVGADSYSKNKLA